jgi:hypothetical protein
MRSDPDSQLTRLLCRLYAVLLWAYPSEFRREFGREMLLVFRNRAREVVRQGGSSPLTFFVLQVGWDWMRSTFEENANMPSRIPALRWLAALPSAILAASFAPKMVFIRITDIRYFWIAPGVALSLMAAAFVSVGVWVAPSRKDSVARIAVSVVVFCGALFIMGSATSMTLVPLVWGVCILIGGVLAYLPWRHRDPSGSLAG